MIFKFWFSACRRKITWGFRIWPYFLHFSMQKWSKTWIYDESDAKKNVRKVFFLQGLFFDPTFYIFTFSPDTGPATLPEGSGLVRGWFWVVWGCFLGSPRPETPRKCKIVKHVVKHVLQRFTTFYNVLQHFTTFYNILQLHRCDGGVNFGRKRRKKAKFSKKKNFWEFF